jgi:hypothetical protein
MKKITIMAISILWLAGCTKDGTLDPDVLKKHGKVTLPIFDKLQSDPDPNPTTQCGSALFYGTMTYLGNVHGSSVNNTCTYNADGTQLALTSDDIDYAANGEQLWTKGSIVITFPTDGSTTATITGGSTIVGGTGPYKNATGYFIYENMVYDLATGHESHTAHGKITITR